MPGWKETFEHSLRDAQFFYVNDMMDKLHNLFQIMTDQIHDERARTKMREHEAEIKTWYDKRMRNINERYAETKRFPDVVKRLKVIREYDPLERERLFKLLKRYQELAYKHRLLPKEETIGR